MPMDTKGFDVAETLVVIIQTGQPFINSRKPISELREGLSLALYGTARGVAAHVLNQDRSGRQRSTPKLKESRPSAMRPLRRRVCVVASARLSLQNANLALSMSSAESSGSRSRRRIFEGN